MIDGKYINFFIHKQDYLRERVKSQNMNPISPTLRQPWYHLGQNRSKFESVNFVNYVERPMF